MNIGGGTRVYALLGRPVAHSRSPALHNRWFAQTGLDAVYVALETDDPRAIAAAFDVGLAGVNVTTPLKAHALARAATSDASAAQVGAANVLVRRAAGWHALNTDVDGLRRALEADGVDVAGRRVAIVGAGGAARAAAIGLERAGAREVRVLARRLDAARAVADLVGGDAGPIETSALVGREIVVIATSGRPPVVAGLDPRVLAPGAAWVDLNYWDADPPGWRAAAAAGCRTIDGTGMLRHQAGLAFAAWTGIALSPELLSDLTRAEPPG